MALLPALVVAHGVLRPGRQVRLDVLESEGLPDRKRKTEDLEDLIVDLLRWADDVSVVLGEAAHPQQPVQHAGSFIPIDGPELGPPQRQLAVGPLAVLVDHQVERAVHRPQVVVRLVDRERRVHVLLEEAEVARRLPEPGLADMRRIDQLVPVAQMLAAPEVLDGQSNAGAFRVPVHQARAGLLVHGVQVQVLADPTVVPLLDLLQLLEMGLQVLAVLPGGPVDPLEHLVLLVSAPVGAGYGRELERVRRKLPGAGDVRPSAQVREGILSVR